METDYKVAEFAGSSDVKIVNLRCPVCNHNGAFHGGGVPDFSWQQEVRESLEKAKLERLNAGVRVCPNSSCRAVVFVITRKNDVVKSYPPQVLDFDATNLPAEVKDSLSEAIQCLGAQCYKASALMVRRTLEELCEDKKSTGPNLKEKLQHLGKNILIPQDLIVAADELRLLGNDAAHIDAKSYNDIGLAEATLAIELAKELLKSTYQYGSLVDKLKALKKTP